MTVPHTLNHTLHRSRRLGPAMWAAIGASVALLGVGMGTRAVEVAAGVLLVACLSICLLSVHTSHRTGKAIDQVTRQVAARRRREPHRDVPMPDVSREPR